MIPWAKPKTNKKDRQHLNHAFKSNWISGGKYIYKLENLLKKKLKAKNMLVVSSGTAAIHLVYLAIGLKKGDEIIIPGYGYLAAANIAKHLNLKIIFADVDPNTFCVTESEIRKKTTSRTKAILITHTYGNMCEIDKIYSFAKKKGILLIEDAAEALFSKFKNKFAGTVGDFGIYSFQAVKTITTGEGGAVTFRERKNLNKLKLFRSHGVQNKRYFHLVPGHNFRLSNLLASIGYSQLIRIKKIIDNRKKVFSFYEKYLNKKKFKMQLITKNSFFVPWAVSIKINNAFSQKKRDKIILSLKKRGIEARNGFYTPYELPIYPKKKLPISLMLSRRIISLPLFESLSESKVKYICSVLNKVST
jgi:perosamine synthetase